MFWRITLLILVSLPALLIFPWATVAVVFLLYLLIPLAYFLGYLRRNVHFGQLTKEERTPRKTQPTKRDLYNAAIEHFKHNEALIRPLPLSRNKRQALTREQRESMMDVMREIMKEE
jgi:hypothetical protein